MANVTIQQAAQMKRVMRRPQHTFQLRYRPWQIQPFMIAPVLPGETMKNLLLQSRIVTDPIKNPIVGWWNEHWIFYVKLRDLYDRDKLTAMIMNPEEDMSSLDSATKVEHYHENTSGGRDIDYVKLCMERVVDEYFRFEGEDFSVGTIGNLPVANINNSSFIDSLINDADLITPADEVLTSSGSEFGTAVNISEVHNAMLRWNLMRTQGLTDMTFEDYLESYGVTPKAEEIHKPELIRYVRDWSYPTNTVDPSNGAPRSAVSWVVSEKADKDRFFREPGFIFGVTTSRPKVYLRGLSSNAVMLMNNAQAWLPPSLSQDPYASMRKVAAGDAPVTLSTDAYWVDIKDILLYGDQFLNFATSATDANIVDLPSAANLMRYADGDDADALFVGASPANLIREDGIVSLSIAGRQTDTSPNVLGTNITV